MERKKNLTLLWRRLNGQELGKDVVQVPLYLGKMLDYEAHICCGYDDRLEARIRRTEQAESGLRFVRGPLGHKALLRIPVHLGYLMRKARRIDLLMCFHWRPETFCYILAYKLLHPQGEVYVKLDTETGREWDPTRGRGLARLLRKRVYHFCLRLTDRLTCETSGVYSHLTQSLEYGEALCRKLTLMPNGFDEKSLERLKIKERTFRRKEKLIITAGRLGTGQKNTEMLLNALARTDLRDWKVCLIGGMEKGFEDTVERFFNEHPGKRRQVTFAGQVDNRRELWEWYNRARVFVLTSRRESYGLVLNEAKRFRNYLVSTPVGAAADLIEGGKYGTLVAQEDDGELSRILAQIISGERETDVYRTYDMRQLSYQERIENAWKL